MQYCIRLMKTKLYTLYWTRFDFSNLNFDIYITEHFSQMYIMSQRGGGDDPLCTVNFNISQMYVMSQRFGCTVIDL